jgi:hypothetical protein
MPNEPRKIFLGNYESVDTLVIPNEILERASAQLDAERAQRAAAKEKAAVLGATKAQGRLRRGFWRGRP